VTSTLQCTLCGHLVGALYKRRQTYYLAHGALHAAQKLKPDDKICGFCESELHEFARYEIMYRRACHEDVAPATTSLALRWTGLTVQTCVKDDV